MYEYCYSNLGAIYAKGLLIKESALLFLSSHMAARVFVT